MLLTNPNNFVPMTRTPWGGQAISELKKEQLQGLEQNFPERIGESWEVSTEVSFPSTVTNRQNETLSQVIKNTKAAQSLGQQMDDKFGNHCPLLLKWLHAETTLSVQLHPNHTHPQLKSNECGKPESWLVMDSERDGFVYLGFKKNVRPDEAFHEMKHGDPDKVLHKIYTQKHQLISVPTGLVHATGRGVLIAEPQFVLPGKIGKTWRLSDWGRRYDADGKLNQDTGKPRELHLDEAWTALNWSFPQGEDIDGAFVCKLHNAEKFEGNKYNPFATQMFDTAGSYHFEPFFEDTFSLFTCVRGQAHFKLKSGEIRVSGGQSGLVEASDGALPFVLVPDRNGLCEISFFSLNLAHL
jgi:mannose-6-phosphate isomerase